MRWIITLHRVFTDEALYTFICELSAINDDVMILTPLHQIIYW